MSKITLFGIKSLFVDFNQARHPKISNNKVFGYSGLLLAFAPMAIYLLLISVVLAWPNVMTALGLQPFVDYVAYDLQLEGYLNLAKLQLWGPDYEVYYFYMQSASILIVGTFVVIIPIYVLFMAILFSDALYQMSRMYSFGVKCIIFIVFNSSAPLLLYYQFIVGPETVSSSRGRNEFPVSSEVLHWVGFLVLYASFLLHNCIFAVGLIRIGRLGMAARR